MRFLFTLGFPFLAYGLSGFIIKKKDSKIQNNNENNDSEDKNTDRHDALNTISFAVGILLIGIGVYMHA